MSKRPYTDWQAVPVTPKVKRPRVSGQVRMHCERSGAWVSCVPSAVTRWQELGYVVDSDPAFRVRYNLAKAQEWGQPAVWERLTPKAGHPGRDVRDVHKLAGR